MLVQAAGGFIQTGSRGAPIGLALIVYGLLFAAFVTDGRVLLDFWGVSQSRYVTFDVLVLVGIYLVALSRVSSGEPTDRGKIVTWGHDCRERGIQVIFGLHYGIVEARSQIEAETTATATARDIDHESPLTVYSLDIGENLNEIKQDVAYLREHHLGPFG